MNVLSRCLMGRFAFAGMFALVALAIASLATTDVMADPAVKRPAADSDKPPLAGSFQLAAFFQRHCVECHGAEEPEGKVALDRWGAQPGSEVELAVWKRVVGQLRSGHMPPDDALQPTPELRRAAIDAIFAGMQLAGVRREGNEVDHDALFSAKPLGDSQSSTEGRLWRLSQSAYENLFLQNFRGVRSAMRLRAPWEMTPDAKTGFSDFAATHRIGEAEMEHHLRNVLPIVRDLMSGRSLGDELIALKNADKSATAEQIDAGVAAAFDRVLRRNPTEQEQERYTGFVRQTVQKSGSEAAVKQLLLATLMHPEVFYRVEMAKKAQQQALAPHHLARAIAYTLTDQGPDEALQLAVAEDRLGTAAEVREQTLRILNDPETSRLRILRFFQEYFGYTAATDVFKDAPTLTAEQVVEDAKSTRKEGAWAEASYNFVRDADWLVLDILEQDRNVLRELLTTRDTYTMTKPDRGPRPLQLADVQQLKRKFQTHSTTRGFFRGVPVELRVYELDELAIRRDAWVPDRRYTMPAGHRSGLLTHPSWLVAQSGNFDNDPIHRGIWIREKLLGEKMPEIPITVDAKLPDEPEQTLRHRMRVTRENYCWKCHQQVDPLGLPFEMYDHFGRHRLTEQGEPVDASGYLSGTGDPKLDGPVKDAVDLIGRLAKSQRVEQVFVRHVFRYFVGRNETLEDGPTLVEAHQAYAQGGGSMKALLASIITSPAFLDRVVDEQYSKQAAPADDNPINNKSNNKSNNGSSP